MRYDRLTILLARVIADQDDHRYIDNISLENDIFFNLVILL